MKLPIVKSLHIENFAGTAINAADYFNKNAIIGQYEDGRIYATQRPSVDIFDDADAAGEPAKGRGVYYWDHANVDDRYFVIDDEVFKGTSATSIHTISGGTQPVYFVEMVNYLVILDPENNEGWYILYSSDTTVSGLTAVGSPDFPPNRTPAIQLTGGGAFLDGRLYVGGTDGAIYGSDSNTPINWNIAAPGSDNKVSAERESDSGVYLDKHHDHIVMFGSRTIEYFYNASNPTGSPLSRRKDIAHNTGMMQPNSAWREGDDIYFVSVYPSGPLSVSRLSQFQITPISTPEVDSYITNARLVEDSNFVSTGFTSGKRSFFIITFYRLSGGVIFPDVSLVFDGSSWGLWETSLCSCGKFPLISWTIRSGSDAHSGEGQMSSGSLITVSDDFNPVDTLLATGYILTGYIASGYYVASGGTGENVEMTVRTGPFDAETNHWKFGHSLEVVGDEAEGAMTATVKWADGNSVNFNAGRSISLTEKQKINRLGRFKRRNYEIVITGSEQYRIEALDMEITEGGH